MMSTEQSYDPSRVFDRVWAEYEKRSGTAVSSGVRYAVIEAFLAIFTSRNDSDATRLYRVIPAFLGLIEYGSQRAEYLTLKRELEEKGQQEGRRHTYPASVEKGIRKLSFVASRYLRPMQIARGKLPEQKRVDWEKTAREWNEAYPKHPLKPGGLRRAYYRALANPEVCNAVQMEALESIEFYQRMNPGEVITTALAGIRQSRPSMGLENITPGIVRMLADGLPHGFAPLQVAVPNFNTWSQELCQGLQSIRAELGLPMEDDDAAQWDGDESVSVNNDHALPIESNASDG